MSEKLDKKILKKIPNKIIPLKIFDKNIINFLDELSKKISRSNIICFLV